MDGTLMRHHLWVGGYVRRQIECEGSYKLPGDSVDAS